MAKGFYGIGGGRKTASFMAISHQTSGVSDSDLTPTYLTEIESEDSFGYFEAVSLYGAMRNVSGRTLTMAGVVSYHINNSNASSRELSFFSETSLDDGVTWNLNDDSARKGIVRGTSEEYATKSSEVFNIPHGALLRFGVFASAIGVSLLPVLISVKGSPLDGPSFRWRMNEL